MHKGLITISLLIFFALFFNMVSGALDDDIKACYTFDVNFDDYYGNWDSTAQTGSPTIVTGADYNCPVGNCLLVGNAEKVQGLVKMNMSGTDSSVAFWTNYTTTDTTYAFVNGDGPTGDGFNYYFTADQSMIYYSGNALNNPYAQGEWILVTMTGVRADNYAILWENGNIIANVSRAENSNVWTAQFGHAGKFFLIDEAMMWDRSLSSTEIKEIYNGGAGTSCSGLSPPVVTGIMNITLDAPKTGVTNTSLSMNFSYLPIDWAADFSNCSLLTNSTSAGWVYNLTDDSVTNNTINKFSNVEFQENEQSGTDVLWNIECEDAGGDINSSAVNWTIHFEQHINISNIYLTSPTPDQELYIGDIGNTTDPTPTFNQTTNKDATCFISTDNASWTICSTTDAIGSICTIGSALDYAQQSIYFTCNSTLTNIDYAERLVRLFSYPNITGAEPVNNSIYIGSSSTVEFNATIEDYTNTTLSCNFSNSTGVQETNVSVDNNSIVRFYQELDTRDDYAWNITCSNGYYESTTGYMNVSFKINFTNQVLCSYMQRVEFYPNITNYNWTTGHLTQYNITAENESYCDFAYNLSISKTGDLQVSLNITFNETFVPRYNKISVNESWVTIGNITSGVNYYINITGSYINATSDSPTFEDYMRVI